MANSATESHRLETAILVEGPFHAENRVELDQSQSSRRIIEVDLALLDLLHQIRGQRIHINFQADRQCRLGTHSRAYAAKLAALNGVVKFELVRPINFITEGVVAEDSASFLE